MWLDGPGVAEGRVCGLARELFLDMNGLALTILVGQLPKLFGFKVEAEGLLREISGFVTGLADGAAVAAAATAGICGIALILVLQRWLPKSLPENNP